MVTVADTMEPTISDVPSSVRSRRPDPVGYHSYTVPLQPMSFGDRWAYPAFPLGQPFPIGANTVTCTATDGSDNTATADSW